MKMTGLALSDKTCLHRLFV